MRTLLIAATLSFAHHGAFTLPQAHHLAVRHEQQIGLGAQVSNCRWLTRRQAGCSVATTLTVIDGIPPALYTWTDIITRAGACATHVTKRTGPDSGIAHSNGNHRPRNCFTGPLVVLAGGGARLGVSHKQVAAELNECIRRDCSTAAR